MKEIIEKLKKCQTITELAKDIYGYSNGKTHKKVKKYIIKYGYEYKFLISLKEKYDKNPKKCKLCSKKISYNKKNNKFCSSNCSCTYNNNKRVKLSEETKRKISFSLKSCKNGGYRKLKTYIRKCKYCKKDFVVDRLENNRLSKRKTCSDKCLSLLKSKNSKIIMNKLISEGKHKGWKSRNVESYPEIFFKKVLDNNNIKYKFNKKISKKSLGINCSSNYFLDFYIPDKKIDLEIDGKQHELKERIESDYIRDKYLNGNGFVVYRIKWKSINDKVGKNYIKNEIDKFIKFYNKL